MIDLDIQNFVISYVLIIFKSLLLCKLLESILKSTRLQLLETSLFLNLVPHSLELTCVFNNKTICNFVDYKFLILSTLTLTLEFSFSSFITLTLALTSKLSFSSSLILRQPWLRFFDVLYLFSKLPQLELESSKYLGVHLSTSIR